MLQEKQFFLSCLQYGPLDIRKISNRMRDRFDTSPAAVKDILLSEGYIELSHSKREGQTQKMNHYYKLTKKKLQLATKKVVPVSTVWEDGTPKSQGNAFDWSSQKCSMFSKAEIAHMNQKYHNNNPITLYSRA
jgi:hypothetical protein